MIEVSVAYGEQKRLILPDSSEVWLNAGSTILYPETFAKDKRLVILNGEAYLSKKILQAPSSWKFPSFP